MNGRAIRFEVGCEPLRPTKSATTFERNRIGQRLTKRSRTSPAPDPKSFDNDPHVSQALAQRALELIQTEFETTTWQAFLACTVSKLTAPQVAAELGLTVAAVYKAKSRVMNRLRRELDGLVDYFRK